VAFYQGKTDITEDSVTDKMKRAINSEEERHPVEALMPRPQHRETRLPRLVQKAKHRPQRLHPSATALWPNRRFQQQNRITKNKWRTPRNVPLSTTQFPMNNRFFFSLNAANEAYMERPAAQL
jgi:hypothetical protein